MSLTFTVPSNYNRGAQKGTRNKKKPFCKVCFDAGKSEKEYTSHYLKDRPGPKGKVICPTLLATECRYCHQHGHFKSHCQRLIERRRAPASKARRGQRAQTSAPGGWTVNGDATQLNKAVSTAQVQRCTSVSTLNGSFAALDDSDDEVEMTCTGGPEVASARAPQGAWKTRLGAQSMQQPKQQPKQEPKQQPKQEPKQQPKQEPKQQPKQQPKQEPAPTSVKILNTAEQNRMEEITLELLELRDDREKVIDSGSWADAGDVDDIDTDIDSLEEELAGLMSTKHC